jgi:hypothetical protein
MIGPLFKTPVLGAPLGEQETVLEALPVAIAGQLKVLDDPGLAATVKSLTGMRDVSGGCVATASGGDTVSRPSAPYCHSNLARSHRSATRWAVSLG